jgi:hypothetical protein
MDRRMKNGNGDHMGHERSVTMQSNGVWGAGVTSGEMYPLYKSIGRY